MKWARDFLDRRPKLPTGEEYGPVTRKITKPKESIMTYRPGGEPPVKPIKKVRYTTDGSEKYRKAMDRAAEEAVDKGAYVRADKETWMREYYPKGIVD